MYKVITCFLIFCGLNFISATIIMGNVDINKSKFSSNLEARGISAEVESFSVILCWEANTESDLTGYAVYRSIEKGSFDTKIATISLDNGPTYKDVITQTGVYYYVVTASNKWGLESDFSNVATVCIKPPLPPTGLKVE